MLIRNPCELIIFYSYSNSGSNWKM
uniref:Uncharacterized protein n=1 Tax=Arundo donax TaxID=35708 RepID=A0A0A9F835_ARUDO